MPDDRPGVARQASTVPDDVRRATYALDSDETLALLVTINQSGTCRFSWLFQELAIPNQEIVELLGRLHEADLIDRTTTGKNEGRESAYVVTDVGEALLEALASLHDTPTESESEQEPEPDPITIRDPL